MRFSARGKAFYCRYTLHHETVECHKLKIGDAELEELLYTIIRKQSQLILNTEQFDDMNGFLIKTEQQSECKKLIEKHRDEKRLLYEKMILGELDTAGYKSEKAKVDSDLDHLNHALKNLNEETLAIAVAKSSDDELRRLAGMAFNDNKLTRPLVEALIDKVYIYPNRKVEIIWKTEDFMANIKED